MYFLTGYNLESEKPALYVGEAENIRDRVKSHLEKDFWNQIIYFISKDENLTKSHIRYLEGRLLEQARHANRGHVMNAQSSGAKLPESDREDMEIFLEKINQLLPVLGVELLVATTGMVAADAERMMLYCEIKGLKAMGRRTPNGFLVLEKFQAVLKERASTNKYPWALNMRQKLMSDGVLSVSDNHLVFTRDQEFTSPSAAAAVIHGGQANGLRVWKNNDGKTLKEIESM